ncbi:hypothetical protein FZEAL_6633 [Fusarium zealandicum]|uniref:F-box domain-containing protein n=1 Tax=Fusarium zealandicum TaxID=1053134 RepID=A0A8H4UHF6_9HYPO|nr:hypothetical protein FZEAL_6633 [Fusarium zealandicum]
MLRLPDEIWCDVFSYFERTLPRRTQSWSSDVPSGEYKNLASLCLVCRQFRRIAQAKLHCTIDLQHTETPAKSIMSLARTLLSKPLLGHHVRAFALPERVSREESRKFQDPMEFFKEALKDHDKLYRELGRFLGNRNYVLDEVFLTVILARMPRLQLLDFTFSPSTMIVLYVLEVVILAALSNQGLCTPMEYFLDIMNRYTALGRGMLQLREIRIGCATEGRVINMCTLEAILLYPKIEALRLFGAAWARQEDRRMRWKDHASNLRFLQIQDCIIDMESLEEILTRCKDLRTLYIQLSEDINWAIDFSGFTRLLTTLGQNLKELDLDTYQFHLSDMNVSQGHLESLQAMTSLRVLKIAPLDLVDPQRPEDGALLSAQEASQVMDALPCSLEELHFYPGAEADIMGNINRSIARGSFPELRKVAVERPPDSSTDPSALVPESSDWIIHSRANYNSHRYVDDFGLLSIMEKRK